jgi:hypothetical protein
MRKPAVTILAAAAVVLLNSLGWPAHAATTAPASAIPGKARNFTPIHEAACRGWGRWCPPGYVRACGPFRCWCRPCW